MPVRCNPKTKISVFWLSDVVHRKFSPTIYALFICCLIATVSAEAQTARSESSEMLRQLLAMPAPTPRTPKADEEEKDQRPPEFYSDDRMPADSAPLDDLLAYWGHRTSILYLDGPKPTPAVRQRLLAAFEAEPDELRHLLPFLPETEAAAERVKKLYDEAQSGARFDESWQKSVREWLQFNSKYFLNELLALARKVKDKDGYVENQEALNALAKVDWSSAEPLLQTLVESGGPRSAALALRLSYQHALEDKDASAEGKYRARLQAIAANSSAPARARDIAIEALSLTEWDGRDEWYLSLFADETLLNSHDGSYGFSPLITLFDRDPDKWIPVMTRLVESKNRAVQQAAASCLVIYAIASPRRDAILPVLRWLSDPDWLKVSPTERVWFMQKMDQLEMPESVPGLIWIVENEENNAHWAARTLAHYKDPRAVPALKKALAQENNEDTRQYIIRALIASGGVPEAEQVAALEAYAAKLTTSEGRDDVERYRSYGDDALPVPVSIGNYLARMKDAPDSLVVAALARVEYLQKRNPELARVLLEITQRWQARQVDIDMLRRIGAQTADAATIANALERREKLRASVSAELQSLVGAGGTAQGVASVLLADESLAQSILGANDQSAQAALLACARLVQMPLPVAQVGALLESKNPNLKLAAERYLLAEDSPEARQLLWARHENEAFITGWRENILLIAGSDFGAMGKAEEKLRTELLGDGAPLEIIALVNNSEQPSQVVRVYKGKAVYTHYEDASRYRERVITSQELAQLKNFIETNHLMELGPQFGDCHHDCYVSEFLSVTKQRGRRMFNHQSIFTLMTTFANFELLGKGDGVKIHYRLENEIKGLEVLLADELLSAKDVWQRGKDLRVFVERAETPEEVEQRQKANDTPDDDEDNAEAAREESRRQEAERARARFSWRAFTNGKPGALLPQPEGYATFDESAFEVEYNDSPLQADKQLVETTTGNYVVFAGSYSKGGLWKKAMGQKAVPITEEGRYANAVVTPDGKWVVAGKAEDHWGQPNYVVRVNLQTNREYRVKLPPADEFQPIAYLATHGKLLLRRAKDKSNTDPKSISPVAPEFYLLDAATGQTQLVTGVFEPLQQEGRRSLQPTGKAYEFWAAIPDDANNRTRVGRYNVKDFSFQTLLVVPHLIFDSMKMWVDEDAAKLYVVYEDQLLRLPLRIAP